MASPSQIAEPSERPVSGLPASASPRRDAFKSYGQDYQYAETWANPLPEIVTFPQADAGQSAAGASQAGGDAANEATAEHEGAPSSHRPDTAGTKEAAMHEDVWVEPPDAPWYRRISKVGRLIIAVTALGTTGVVLAILGAMGLFSGHRSVDRISGGFHKPLACLARN